ncbi:OTU domain-containing protein 4 [Maylandia zebra]|uniref:OTU domain-containing protein 4 n=1 Tax=Maylandia zebra TaxID=106582 RepID=UPI00403C12AC
MDGGGSMQSIDERGVEKLMDDYLKSIGLHRKKIAKDGSCLFRAVAEQVLHCQSLHTKVRAKCVEFLKQNRDTYEAFIEGDFEDYLCKLQDPQQWVGEVEINALAAMYKRDFLIFQEPGKPAVNITGNNFKDKVQLCFLNGNHYDSVYPISRIKNTALCQSVLYELLYEGVFKVDRSYLGSCQRIGRPADLLSDDCMPACPSSDDSDLDVDEALWVENGTSPTSTKHNQSYRGRGRGLPQRVRRSLNPTLLRNVEYDVWHKSKRAQQKLDYCIAAGMQFTVGDRCQVRLEGTNRLYSAVIKEVPANNQPVTVYIEDLGRKQVVPLWSVRPPSDDSGWSKVGNRDKRLSNGHGGEWEERGRGRGRGKSVGPSSSSGSQAAAPGSGGRTLKQHSWPPQANVEEQGGAKTSRKSVGAAEVAFGLTEEQRLAKEEEERNVALVEIQLRDEHSFPALGSQPGTQGEGGKRKGEKKRSQRNKTKSPVEDVRAPSPSALDKPTPSTPPLTATSTTTTPDTMTSPALPAAKPSDSTPSGLNFVKALMPNASPSVSLPLTSVAPAAKTNTPSYASATAAPGSPPPPAAPPAAKPSPKGEAPLPPSVPSSAFSYSTPVLPAASPTSSSSSKLPPASVHLPKPTTSPPPSSSVPPPTFITPIASPPTAAPGFPAARSSPPITSLLCSQTPPSSSSLIHPSAEVREAPPAPPPTTNSLPNTGGPLMASQAFQSEIPPPEVQTQVSVPSAEEQAESSLPQIQTESQASLPQIMGPPMMLSEPQDQPQSGTEAPVLPQTDLQPHIQTSYPTPVASYPQASLPHPPAQAPHPSQVPHPSLSLSASTIVPQTQTEAPPQQHQSAPESQAPPASEKLSPPHPPHTAPPQPLPGSVPLQQMSQLYQDLLYPGFPQGERGEIAATPNLSSNKSGDDLPTDVNILRFFFNLGVKAYSMPIYPPYLYLVPLQQAHAMQPKPSSRSPSPQCLPSNTPSNTPTNPQEGYPPHQYPPTVAPVPSQYDNQAALDELPGPAEPSFNQARYPITQPQPPRMPWQQMPARNPSYSVGYLSPPPPYSGPPPSSQGYHPNQGAGVPVYPTAMGPYSPSSLAYQTASTHQELQVSQGAMQQHQLQAINGDTMPGHGNIHISSPLESAAASNIPTTNSNRSVMVPSNYSFKRDPGESLPRAVLLVDPPLNDMPIVALLSDPHFKDISMGAMKGSSSSPGSPSQYRPRKPVHATNVYEQSQRGSYMKPVTMTDNHSVGCSTEDDWEEVEGFKTMVPNYRGQRRPYRGRGGRGGRGRGGYDPTRDVYRSRQERDMGVGYNYIQPNPAHMGWAREKRY